MNTPSEQRKFLNDVLLPHWAEQFGTSQLVYDIGKSTTWDYTSYFKCQYQTIDRESKLQPNILIDMENYISFPGPMADGIVLNGVFEQCDNPFKLIHNVEYLLKDKGLILFGLPLTGMKPYGLNDKWRLTIDGARAYVKIFSIIREHIFPEYVYLECRK